MCEWAGPDYEVLGVEVHSLSPTIVCVQLCMIVQASMELGPEDVSLLERCPHFRGCYVQALMELGPEDVSLLERCPHFRGCYVQASMELGYEDVSLLERCPHFRECYVKYPLHDHWTFVV